MSNKLPINKFEQKEILSKNKEVIATTLLNEHQRAEALARKLTEIYDSIDAASTAGKTQPPNEQETSEQAKIRINGALKNVLDNLKKINLNDTTNMVPITTLNNLASIENEKSAENDKDIHQEQIIDASRGKSYKLDSNTKPFSGNPGERVSQWLFIINDAFTAQNVQTDQLKLSLVTNYLKGSAFNALMRYRKNANPTWTGFEDLLRSQFEDSNLDYKIRTQFFHLKMTDSFSKYLTRFQELLNQMTDHSGDDTDILYKFTDGLTKEYALAVRRDKCETLNEAIKVCQDIDCLSRNFNYNGHIQESVNKVK